MSLAKAIAHGKERRRQYRKSKAFDYTCRNHGSCPYCKNNRLHKFVKCVPIVEDEAEGEKLIYAWRLGGIL
jgi:hypothetical protein